MKEYEMIALIGEAGTGKDTIMQKVLLANPQLVEIISSTTRPPREGEVDGVNYYFITPEQFAQKVLNGEMLEAVCFNDWFYGSDFTNLRKGQIHIGVFNPEGVEALMADPRLHVTIFRVCASDKTRLLRQLNREENPDCHEIVRRFGADYLDFGDLDFPMIIINNEDQDDLIHCTEIITEFINNNLLGKNDK